MGKIYSDSEGNRLFITRKQIYAKDRKGFLISSKEVMRLMDQARRKGLLKENIREFLGERKKKINNLISQNVLRRRRVFIRPIPKKPVKDQVTDIIGLDIEKELDLTEL